MGWKNTRLVVVNDVLVQWRCDWEPGGFLHSLLGLFTKPKIISPEVGRGAAPSGGSSWWARPSWLVPSLRKGVCFLKRATKVL